MTLYGRYLHCRKVIVSMQDLITELDRMLKNYSFGNGNFDLDRMWERREKYSEMLDILESESHYCELIMEYNQDHSW